MDYPTVSVVVTTYFPNGDDGLLRRDVALATIMSWIKHIRYSGHIEYVVADDGTDSVMFDSFLLSIKSLWGYAPTNTREERCGIGASLNRGFAVAFQISPIVLFLVDDWSLTVDLDLDPWVQLLMEREDVGMVRLGPPHPNVRGSVEAFTANIQSWGLRLDRYGFAFGHRPALYHKRFFIYYGPFDEKQSALETERLYSERFNTMQGPDIVVSLPHPFFHIDSIELAYLEPK